MVSVLAHAISPVLADGTYIYWGGGGVGIVVLIIVLVLIFR